MGDRGRQSANELAVIGISGAKRADRPSPPADLTEAARDEWRKIVNSYPAERFTPGQVSLLRQHCQHTASSQRITALIREYEQGEEFSVAEYDRLLKMQERESRCLASLAVRLGFAYSTSYEKRPSKKGDIKRPWETD